MFALGIVLNIIGLGFFCWVLCTLVIYALPFFIGMTVGLYMHNSGTGPLGAVVTGVAAWTRLAASPPIGPSGVGRPALS